MEPALQINFLAILVCIVANFVIGFVWYGPLFGASWMREVGLDPEQKPSSAHMIKAMAMMGVGAFLTAYVLNHSTEVWRPSVWGHEGDLPTYMYGVFATMFTWVGFYLPQHFSSVAWEMRSWRLFFINAGNTFVSLAVMGQILSNWR
ncbi:MAG: DUF1761 domain-containing protein [bacterium]|nr:DUF1761 domain-containing protein [bacterium]